MQYKIAALCDAVRRAFVADELAQQDRFKARYDAYERAQAEWLEQHLARWHTAAKRITSAVRRGVPVTAEMIPGYSGGYARLDAFNETHPGEFEYRPDAELVRIANALELIPDETASPRDLAALGVNGGALRYVLGMAPVRGGKSTAVAE
jgi:hypothetical protein